MKSHIQRYRLINVGPHKINKILEVPESGDTTYGLEEWLCENLGHRVACYLTEDLDDMEPGQRRTKLAIKMLWGGQPTVGRAVILLDDDAVILDMDSYRKMFERRKREEQCRAM